jgi:DNA helicase-2/ATP-dependent DNA helicase PcrA
LFPLYQVAPEPNELEEERRLFYVGITRAMKKLYFTHARLRYRFGDVTYPVLSRFAEEIDPSLIQRETSRRVAFPAHPRSGSVGQEGSHFSFKENHTKRQHGPIQPGFDGESEPDYENESQEIMTLRVGAKVEHESFGLGKVLQLAGAGESAKAVVLFDSVGPKNLMLKYAKLRLL